MTATKCPDPATDPTIERLIEPDRRSWSQLLRTRLPISIWLPAYTRHDAPGDAIAGITAGLAMIAQALAYASLTEMPPQYGLYSSFVGTLVYVVLGTVREVSIGPTSLNSLLTLQYTVGKPVEYAALLAFIAGIVQLFVGIFQLSFIVNYISVPVISGFVSASVSIIIVSQLKHVFGVTVSSPRFFRSLYELAGNIGETRWGDLLLALGCAVGLIGVRALQSLRCATDTTDKRWSRRALRKTIWYLGISSNALLVVASVLVAAYSCPDAAESEQTCRFRLSGSVEAGLPAFRWPQLENAGEFGLSGILVVPLVSLLTNVAITKALADGRPIDATQEILALGTCNVLGSLFGSMPVAGAFTRSLVIRSSGVRTPFVGVWCTAVIVLAMTVMTPFFYYIPRSSLAAILVMSVVQMIDYEMPLRLWRNQRSELWPWLLTASVCLVLGLEHGLFAGALYTTGRLLLRGARPKLLRCVRTIGAERLPYVSIENVSATEIRYPCADWIREHVHSAARATEFAMPVVLHGAGFDAVDYTTAQAIAGLVRDLQKVNLRLCLFGFRVELRDALQNSGAEFASDSDELDRFVRLHIEDKRNSGQQVEIVSDTRL